PGSRVNWFATKLSAEKTKRGQKAFLVQTAEELRALFPVLEAHPSGVILQQAIDGGEENVVSYHAYVRHDGEIAAEFTGKKVRTAPRTFGLSSCVEITDDEEVRRLGRRVLEKLDFTGVVKLDFKQDARDDRLYL